ncbi:MAG: glycosyltransferase family 4 protein [Solirubrobacteraceae bacterium]|nr:glycosyltransferase family 4 protein [Solirubrobacteraceae bacterium]
MNALFLDPGVSGGPETYLRGLAPAIARARPDVELTVVTTHSGATTLAADGWTDFARIVALNCEDGQRLRRQVAEQIKLPSLARARRFDVLHSLASIGPVWTPGVRHVVTLHDVTFMHQKTFGPATTAGMKAIVAGAARDADALLSGTAAARDDVCATLGLDPAQFVVAHHGRRPAPPAEGLPIARVTAEHDLAGRRVVLCVGAKRPHKNQGLLVRALPSLPDDVVLALVGHPEPYDRELRELAESLGVTGRVRFIDYVPDADLEALFRLADAFGFPTLGEGFGLPVIEALDRGLPVACSSIPVLREVGGDAVHLFDPYDPASAAAAVSGALLDGDRIRTAGPAWAARFTWDAAAQATLDAYDRALRA